MPTRSLTVPSKLVCGEHPHRSLDRACCRCGDFYCSDCFESPELCRTCFEILGPVQPIEEGRYLGLSRRSSAVLGASVNLVMLGLALSVALVYGGDVSEFASAFFLPFVSGGALLCLLLREAFADGQRSLTGIVFRGMVAHFVAFECLAMACVLNAFLCSWLLGIGPATAYGCVIMGCYHALLIALPCFLIPSVVWATTSTVVIRQRLARLARTSASVGSRAAGR